MDKLDVILWAMTAGFTIQFGLMLLMWNSIGKLGDKIDKLDEKVTDIDRRLCRIEGTLSARDCCMLKEDRHVRKAE